jgi:hypothetical protein
MIGTSLDIKNAPNIKNKRKQRPHKNDQRRSSDSTTSVDDPVKVFWKRYPTRVASLLYICDRTYNTTIQEIESVGSCYRPQLIRHKDPSDTRFLTLPLNHNLSKLKLRRNTTSCLVDSDFVNPSAT